MSQVRKLRELEEEKRKLKEENRKLKQMYAGLTLDNQILRDVIEKKYRARYEKGIGLRDRGGIRG